MSLEKSSKNKIFWIIADEVKRRLYGRLRIATAQINYLNYKEYRKRFEEIPTLLLNEWERIKRDYESSKDAGILS